MEDKRSMSQTFHELISKIFIDPSGANKLVKQREIRKAMDLVVDILASARDRPIFSEDNQLKTPISFPAQSHPYHQVLDQIRTILMSGMNHATSTYIGQMDTLPNIGSVIGEFASAALNNNMLAYEMSPSLSKLESMIIREFCRLFGLSKNSGGLMTSGGSLANLHAFVIARNRKLNKKNGCIQGDHSTLRAYASSLAHTSIDKAGMITGIGADNVIKIPCDEQGRMISDKLVAQILEDIDMGHTPFMVISTFGTTNLGSTDQVKAVATVCRQFDLWHHIDAIYGGAMHLSRSRAIDPELFSEADSVAFNPQKWLFVAKTCSLILFSDFSVLEKFYRIGAPYMSNGQKQINLGELGIQGSRHADALKLYLSLYLIGFENYSRIIDHNLELTAKANDLIINSPYLERFCEPEMNITLFRYVSEGSNSNYQNSLTEKIQKLLLSEHNVYLGLVKQATNYWLKLHILNPFTTEQMIVNLFKKIHLIIGNDFC